MCLPENHSILKAGHAAWLSLKGNKQASEKLSDLLKVTQLVHGRVRTNMITTIHSVHTIYQTIYEHYLCSLHQAESSSILFSS